MTHVRTTIRQRFISVLEQGLSPMTYDVLGARTSKRNRKQGGPDALVDVRFIDITVEQTTMGDERMNTGTLLIRVQREAPEENLDDLLDEDEVRVMALINAFNWLTLLEQDPELVQITFARDGESESTIGVLILRLTVEYRIDKNNPEVVRT